MERFGEKKEMTSKREAVELRWRRRRFLFQATVGIGVIVVAFVFFGPTISIETMLSEVQRHGIFVFYGAYVILTLVGAPSTAFYLIAGAAFPLWQNLLVVAAAIVIHFLIAWWLSARLLRRPLLGFLKRRGIRIPAVTSENEWRVTFLIRFTPGVALCLKSYALGVAGVRLPVFLAVSFLGTYGFAVALLTMGRSATEGNTGLFLGGLALMVFVIALVRIVRKKTGAAG